MPNETAITPKRTQTIFIAFVLQSGNTILMCVNTTGGIHRLRSESCVFEIAVSNESARVHFLLADERVMCGHN